MISVIHLCPTNTPEIDHYVGLLTKALGSRIDCRVADSDETLKRMVAERPPHILHIHGATAGNRTGSQRHAVVQTETVRRVITPHGTDLDNLDGYYVVIARSMMEKERLKDRQAKSKGRTEDTDGRRIEIVRNPIITKTIDFDEVARRHLAIYRKVMDSNVRPLMNDHTLTALRLLLKAGTTGDPQWLTPHTMPADNDVDYRQIALYTHYEQVDEVVRRGAAILGKALPTVDSHTAYLPNRYALSQEDDYASVVDILQAIATRNMLNMRLLAELDRALRDSNLDESELIQMIERKRMKPLLQSVLQILTEELLTDEGFLPALPVDNRETQRLRTLLVRHQNI